MIAEGGERAFLIFRIDLGGGGGRGVLDFRIDLGREGRS